MHRAAGGEGFLDVKGSKGNPHKLIITLSNLFTTPLATGIPFSYKDMTPVAMMALDEFVLWVNADDGQLTEIGPKVPSEASPDHGAPFAAIFERYGHDFYKIDPLLFSPAQATLNNLRTGTVFTSGRLHKELLLRSFGLTNEKSSS